MTSVRVLFTNRVGQLTGSTDLFDRDPKWPLLVDAEQWPLLNDTGRWGALGADLGANTEHSDGRLYIFFGDTTKTPNSPNEQNTDLVAWTDANKVLRHGGHLALGWKFFLPNDHQGATEATGQKDWRFCAKCHGLFWAQNDQPAGVCPRDGLPHDPIGWKFFLPNDHQGATEATGQKDWRFCAKCHGLFWAQNDQPAGVCPRDGLPHDPIGWKFFLPNDHQGATEATGQKDWRFCAKCHGLFWDGDAHKGSCKGSPGGGFDLNPVLAESGFFDPFTGTEPIGQLLSLETPNGAFSYANKVWVFAGFAEAKFTGHSRPGDPPGGCYLTSKAEPHKPGLFQKEFLLSPQIGWCPRDASRDRLESHELLGFKFTLSENLPPGTNFQANYRRCRNCETLFWDGDPNFKGRCHRGGSHEAADQSYVLLHSVAENAQNQANWLRCEKCLSIFWKGAENGGLCPAGGAHQPSILNFVLHHNPGEEGKWRYCIKCHSLVRTGQEAVFSWVAPCVVQNSQHPGLPQTPHEQGLVMYGFFYSSNPGIRLAWMPLRTPAPPMIQDILYYTGNPAAPWSPNVDAAVVLFSHTNTYTHLSAAWLEGPKRWILLYSNANDESGSEGYHRPAVARVSSSLWDWSDEIEIFNPNTQGAYGRYMHQVVGTDRIWPDIPPSDPNNNHEGWAYGAFLLNRFTEWNATNRELDIYYLLSLSLPYQVQLMHSRLLIPDEVTHASRTSHLKLLHGGNGTTLVDSGLPLQGIFYGVTINGDLEWNRYTGSGEQEGESSAAQSWDPQTGNLIGRGWNGMLHVFGCGDGIIMAIHSNGNLHWYSYIGNGEHNPAATSGWHPNSGNVIGNGWQSFRNIFVFPQAGRSTDRMQIFGVAQNGDLHWYSYIGNGEHNPEGTTGWHPNSGNRVGNGWQNFRHLHGSGNVVFGVNESGNLLWYSYDGEGEDDVSGGTGWHPNSGNPIGRGWQNMQHIFGGVTDLGQFGHIIMAVDQNRNLLWYKYTGQGERDDTGSLGWHPRSGNRIGVDW
ncbi:hypothetical protein LC653_34895 [Nostoc sp. CHAB 5784]|uniref:tachylectin-related carbohydrate-binding protein n=1 Tax=Nostoc mirabile TaxID=2907820 RepID=UPI001E55ECF7|nr:tachylectin-related carbohydrate-binding protein [Nostoc mirabile]MCC5668907.1 hypothetical protein [Nostoc mirabile CHAB5784]